MASQMLPFGRQMAPTADMQLAQLAQSYVDSEEQYPELGAWALAALEQQRSEHARRQLLAQGNIADMAVESAAPQALTEKRAFQHVNQFESEGASAKRARGFCHPQFAMPTN
jgi:hypothetical protein